VIQPVVFKEVPVRPYALDSVKLLHGRLRRNNRLISTKPFFRVDENILQQKSMMMAMAYKGVRSWNTKRSKFTLMI
jgi:hypothetical protein